MTASSKDDLPKSRSRSRATTPEARENELVSLAYDLAEKQLRDGTASAAVISSLLKYGSQRERAEREKLLGENSLLKARVEQLASSSRSEDLAAEALKAFRGYSGQDPEEGDDDLY